MMNNESAFPTFQQRIFVAADGDRVRDFLPTFDPYGGLTKRELFAAMAMQGLCLNTNALYERGSHNAAIAERAVVLADALIAELAKVPE